MRFQRATLTMLSARTVPIALCLLSITACSSDTGLPEERQARYVCSTVMPLAASQELKQEFSVAINERNMLVQLRQSAPGDLELETYRYTRITSGEVAAINPKGVVAILADAATLTMRLNESGPAITGRCSAQ